jgi:hypothetical protein
MELLILKRFTQILFLLGMAMCLVVAIVKPFNFEYFLYGLYSMIVALGGHLFEPKDL